MHMSYEPYEGWYVGQKVEVRPSYADSWAPGEIEYFDPDDPSQAWAVRKADGDLAWPYNYEIRPVGALKAERPVLQYRTRGANNPKYDTNWQWKDVPSTGPVFGEGSLPEKNGNAYFSGLIQNDGYTNMDFEVRVKPAEPEFVPGWFQYRGLNADDHVSVHWHDEDPGENYVRVVVNYFE